MATPLQVVTQALLAVGAIADEEAPTPAQGAQALGLMNDMIDQWSNDRMMIYAVQEVIHELSPSQYVYQIGPNGNVGATFTGSIAANLLTVTAISAGAISVGQIISGTGITAGTTITSLGTALGGNGANALGTFYVSKSQTVASTTIASYAPRPLRINSAFVRIVNSASGTLDYPVAVLNVEDYELLGIKTLPGPWPRAVYYNPTEPVGILYYWPNPSSGEMHLFCDTILGVYATLNDTITLPQGYAQALRWNLAEQLMPYYPATAVASEVRGMIPQFARDGRGFIKRTNMNPQQNVHFDPILNAGRRHDAGWILDGGFR